MFKFYFGLNDKLVIEEHGWDGSIEYTFLDQHDITALKKVLEARPPRDKNPVGENPNQTYFHGKID